MTRAAGATPSAAPPLLLRLRIRERGGVFEVVMVQRTLADGEPVRGDAEAARAALVQAQAAAEAAQKAAQAERQRLVAKRDAIRTAIAEARAI